MPTPLLTRKLQFLAKIQSVAGTAETLAAADGTTRVEVGVGMDYQAPKIIRNIARSSLSPLGMIASTKAGMITLVSEITCPDVMTAFPEQEPLLRSSGMIVTALKRIAVGAISGGPMLRNATLTGGTSTATGRLVKDTVTGEGFLSYMPISGTFASGEVITASGGGTATSSAVPTVFGASAQPVSVFNDFITAELQNDGFAWSIRDAFSNMAFDVEASKQGKFKFTPLGAKSVFGTKAMTTGITFNVGQPPILQNATLTIGSFSPVFNKVSFDMKNKVVLRQDGNAPGNTGIQGARITMREPTIKINLEFGLQVDKDWYANYDSSLKEAIKFQIGTAVGSRFFFFAPSAEIMTAPLGDTEGIRSIDVDFLLTPATTLQNGDGDFELLWL